MVTTVHADRVFRGGRIYTGDPERLWAEALAIQGDRFVAVDDVQGAIGPDTEVVELHGAFVMPGLYDLHVHPDLMLEPEVTGGIQTEPLGPDELAGALTDWAARHPGDGWVFGGTWFEPGFRHAGIAPGRGFLDAIVPGRPVALLDAGRHVMMANTRALELAGIDEGTFEPDHGRIDRDTGGRPSGLLADGAQSLMSHVLPAATWQQMEQVYAEGEAVLNRHGFVGARSVHVNTTRLQGLQALHRRSAPSVRWQAAISWKDDLHFAVPDRAALLTSERFRYRSRHVDANLVKLRLDGTPASKTAFFLDPYRGEALHRGRLNESPEEVRDLMIWLDRQGIAAVIHVIGDAAARVALDGIEAARRANGPGGPRHTLAQCSFLHPEDLARFAELDVVAEFSHTTVSSTYVDVVDELLREYVSDVTMPRFLDVAGVLEADGTAVLGSDWVVMPTPEVFPSVAELVTRARTPGRPVSIHDAILMLTWNGAYAFGLESVAGSIEIGKLADLVVLDRDLTMVSPDDIGATRVLATVFEGRTVYES